MPHGQPKTPVVRCLDCDEVIRLRATPKLGQRIVCSTCDAEMEVVGVSPLELEWAIDEEWDDEEEDWDDDDDY